MKPMTQDEKRSLPIFVLLAAVCLWALAESLCGVPLHGSTRPKFDRPAWGAGLPGNGMDLRAEVIATRCKVLAWTPSGKAVAKARCWDWYAGEWATREGRDIHLDHEFSAARAWFARTWRNSRGGICKKESEPARCSGFMRFYNDPLNLTVTSAATNRAKSDLGPDLWCARNRSALPRMARRWRMTAARYQLPYSDRESRALEAWAVGICLVGAKEVGR